MRILEINTERSWRGGERQTFFNIRGLKDCGNTVELLCRKGYPLAEKARALGIVVHEVNAAADAIPFLLRNGSSYDIIHAQTAKAQFHAVLTRPFHQRPVVYSRRVDFVPKGAMTKMKYLLTTQTVAISEAIRGILVVFGIKNVALISDAVEQKTLDRSRAEQIIREAGAEGKKIIGTTAALVQHKDPLTMVRAIAALSAKRNDFIFLHFGDGVLHENVRSEIERLNISHCYKLMGFIPDVEDLFCCFDVFTMSSEEEGLGSSVLDAFIYKVPVATTDAGGLKEIAQHHAMVSRVKDHDKLADNINELLEDHKLVSKLKEEAYHYVLREHSVEKIAKEYHELFTKLIHQ